MDNKESQIIEFKTDWRDEHLRAISAFANSQGGELVLGLNVKGRPIGLANAKKLLEDIPNIIRNKLGILPQVALDKKDGLEIIRVKIFPSSIPISCNGKFYLRSGSTVQELDGGDLADFLMKKTGTSWDDAFEEKANRDMLDHSAIEDFKRYANDRIPSIVRETDVATLLRKLNLVENQNLKRAAILLFAKEPQQLYSHAIVKIGRFLTDTDIQTTDIVSGNLFRQVENSLEILRTKYLLSNIKFEGIHRRDVLEYPYEALREAIINALIHRDYRGFSQTQIRIYPDKLVIMNEGSLPPEVPVEALKTNHLSKPRNKLLAQTLYYAGFIEAWGRGTTMIVEKCLEQGLPEPEFLEDHGVMTVIFHKDVFTMDFLKTMELTERQIEAVMYVKEKGKITNSIYQEMFKLKKRQATDDLNHLLEMQLIERVGTTGKGTYYVLRQRGTKGAKTDSKGALKG